VHGEGHSTVDHQWGDEPAGDRDQRRGEQGVLGGWLGGEVMVPGGVLPPTTMMMMRARTRITSLWAPYRALSVWMVITASGVPTAQVILAGDAAHVFTPATGMRLNLALHLQQPRPDHRTLHGRHRA